MDSSEYEEGLEKTSQKTSTFGDVLKANLASQAIVSGVKKIASAVTEIGKASLEAYGDYEQLAGGAQLMFGEAYNTVAQNAKNAYKTVQMSQNDYLQQVNGFATGLKTALGGNEQAAADLAHKIVVAEADVVAATGNTQEAVQNAFNGIMRSNYTMIDNLQLGITPTKEGFQQLIDKVNEWNTANGRATSYTIDNLADCQSALVDYIEMQGLAGYASEEAAGTIQGSVASMKAAWSNLATGMADETADMEQLTQDFVDSVGIAAKNIIPRVQQIVIGVGTATAEGISYLRDVNGAIDLVITGIENIGTAAAIMVAGFTLQKIITGFGEARVAVALLTADVGKANLAQAALNGMLSLGEVAVGLLTGQISLTTLATEAWAVAQQKVNTAIAANPLGALAILIAAVVASTKGAISAGEKYMAQLKKTDGTVEGVRAKYNQLNRELTALQDTEEELGYLEDEDMRRKMSLEQAIADLEQQLTELEAAENAAKEAMAEFSGETQGTTDAIQSAAETYAASAQAIMEEYYDTYNSIYGKLYDAAGMFTEVATAMEITYDDMMKTLDQNIQFQERFNENLAFVKDTAEGAGVNIDGFIAALSEMDKSQAAGILAAVRAEIESTAEDADGTSEALSDLMLKINEYGDANAEGADSLATTVTNVEQKMNEALQSYTAAVQGLDQAAEAIEAGKNTMDGLLSGITSGTPGVLTAVDSLASQMKSKLSASFSDFVLNIKANVTATKDGSFKSGLDYVPFDGFIAELHKGERVLTAEEASAYRAGKNAGDGTSGIVINQYIQTPVETPAEVAAATEAYFQQARWAVAL